MKKQKYYIITIGCQMNRSDSERFASRLEKFDYKKTNERKKADLVVVTTCGVRQTAEDRIYGLIPRIKKDNPKTKIIVTGCLVYREDVKKRLNKYVNIWLPINQISNFFPITDKQSAVSKQIKKNISDYLSIKPSYINKFSALVPIGNGCNNYCSYCVVPYARGREVYRPVKEIINEVKSLVKKGYKEITLIAQNVNSYKSTLSLRRKGHSEVNFSKLLMLINSLDGNFRIRFMTSHPKDMSDELINMISDCEKVCHHIHLPIQAGDDKVLVAMNRKYTVKHFKELVKKIKKTIPDVSLTTDVIVGFPGETQKQFNNTKKVFKDLKFDFAYISRYSQRPFTAAAKLKDDIPKTEKRRRENEIDSILKKTALANNKKYLNKKVEVLVEGVNKKGELLGKTRTDKIVRFKNNDLKFKNIKKGDFIWLKITKVQDFGMEGSIVDIC